ncbi:MAG: hemin-binding protein [Prevotella sp.]|nr:hemin-binding protein [Prevotella sp.]
MKRIFTFFAAALLCVAAGAQVDETFQFVDADGNVVTDGSVITVNTLNEEGQMVVPLSVKNVSGAKAAVGLYETIDQMPGGTWQTCAFGSCMVLEETGYSPKSVVADNYNASIDTEWIPETDQYATWEAKLQIHVFNVTIQSKFGTINEVAGTEIIGYGPTVTVRFEYKAPAIKLWWGYNSKDDEYTGLGTSTAETYDCASFYSGTTSTAAGKTIHAVRFALPTANVKDVKVWIAKTRPTKIENALQVVSVPNPVKGINEVPLTTPYNVGTASVYVGYSFTITRVSTNDDMYPVCVTGSDLKNALWIRTSTTLTSWSDLNGQGFGRLYLQMLLEGEFPYTNAVSIATANLGESVAAIGGNIKLQVPFTNEGSEDVTSIDYTISNGQTGQLTFASPIAFGSTRNVTIEMAAANEAGLQSLKLTVTKVNGKDNECDKKDTNFTMATVLREAHKCVAVEEFTGTGCGWCPRGYVGMMKMRDKFGDNFAGIAIHRYDSSDAMYISTYTQVSFTGAPSCRINRGEEIDPYYGSGNDVFDDVRAELAIPAKVDVSVKGEWNEDSTQVVATATIESLIPNGNYKIEYVLVADSLTGTTSGWNQANYYYQYNRRELPADLAIFASGGTYGKSSVKGLIFNDVAIAVAKSTQTTAPGILELGVPTENTYTLAMPTKTTLLNAITKNNVTVMALVIDASTKRIVNTAKFLMPGYKPAIKGDVNEDSKVDVADISSILTVMATSEAYSRQADVNDDGKVDVADIARVISIMAGE